MLKRSMAALRSKHRNYTVIEVLEHIADGNISDVDIMRSDEEDGDADVARSTTVGEDRDEPLLPMVGEEIEIEAEESQDQEVRDDYEHEADPIHDPLANVTKN